MACAAEEQAKMSVHILETRGREGEISVYIFRKEGLPIGQNKLVNSFTASIGNYVYFRMLYLFLLFLFLAAFF